MSEYRRMTDSLPTCMSCGAVLYGVYCSQCGQRSAEPITWGRISSGLVSKLKTMDSRWARTAAALTIDPGRMIRRYIRGRRMPFVAPPVYALAAVALCLAVVFWQGSDLAAPGTPWSPSVSANVSADATAQSAGTTPAPAPAEPWPGPEQTVFAICALSSLFVAAATALLQSRLFQSHDFTWAETYVFSLFVFGQLAIHQGLFALMGAFSSTIGLAALAVVFVLFLAFAMSGFYRRSLLASLPAALLLATVQVAGIFVLGSLARIAMQS